MYSPDEAALMDNTRGIWPKSLFAENGQHRSKTRDKKPSFAWHFRKGYCIEIYRQRVFPTPYECVEHFVAGPSVPCTVQYRTNVGRGKKTRKTSRPRQSGHVPWYMQYSSYHRNVHLHNLTSCPSASKATSSLNTPQDPSLKRNTLLKCCAQ